MESDKSYEPHLGPDLCPWCGSAFCDCEDIEPGDRDFEPDYEDDDLYLDEPDYDGPENDDL